MFPYPEQKMERKFAREKIIELQGDEIYIHTVFADEIKNLTNASIHSHVCKFVCNLMWCVVIFNAHSELVLQTL